MSELSWEEKIEKELAEIKNLLVALSGGGFKTAAAKEEEGGLVPGKFLKEITGSLIDAPKVREVNTKNGPTDIYNFTLNTEEYGEVRIGLWDTIGKEASRKLAAGYFVHITSLSIRDEYDGISQLSSTRNTKVTLEDS